MAAEYHQLLTAKGFYCYERCLCSGVHKEKYKPKKEELCMEVIIFPVYKTFLIYKDFYQAAKGQLTIFTTTLNNLCK